MFSTEQGFTIISSPPAWHKCPDPDEFVAWRKGKIIECDQCGAWWEAHTATWWKMDPFEKLFKRIALFFTRKN